MDQFVAMADPTRRQIVESLSLGERSFGELAAQFEISRPAVSQHLKVLRETGIVNVRADAQRRIYSLQDTALEEIANWTQQIRRFWPARLAQLEQALALDDSAEGKKS